MLRKTRVLLLAAIAGGSIVLGIASMGTAAAPPRSCPANASADLYVDPVVDRARRLVPTGVSSPAECAFASIGDAIDSAEARGLGAGARIILTGATATEPAVFGQETFPLAIPVDITVTTTDDPELGGAGLDPRRYVVKFTGRAAYAADLEGGRLAGVTFKNERTRRATIMLICDAGTTELEAVTLDGAGTAGGAVAKGLQLWPGCDLDASDLRVRGFAGNGVIVEEGADLTLTSTFRTPVNRSHVHNNGGDGLTVRGVVDVSDTQFAFNGDDGILVERSASATFDANIIRDNANNGVEVHASNVTFHSNDVFNNSRASGWNQPQMLFVGPTTTGVPLQTPSGTKTAYRVGGDLAVDDIPGCNPGDANRIYSYFPDPAAPPSGGLRAIDGAIVDARLNWWGVGGAENGVTSDSAGSYVDADRMCGAMTDVPDSTPVE